MKLAELDINKLYTYADYLKWRFDERVELIRGKIFPMSAPNTRHQVLAMELSGSLWSFLQHKPCSVFAAPFDVRLTRKNKDDNEVTNVVQPDVCVVCDRNKLDARGCNGAPDIIIEILSPGNNLRETRYKYEIYEEAGVLEYWIVLPQDNIFLVNKLVDGKYISLPPKAAGDVITTDILPGYSIDLGQLFSKEL